jgi:DNA polymerase III delta prime subunit
MGSEERRGRDVIAVGMHPGEGLTFEDSGRRYANSYKPTAAVEALPPTPFEVECFQFIWSRMLDSHYQQWLMKFYAYALKHPGKKIQVAPLLVSHTTGTGKSTITNAIPRLLFGDILEYSEAQLKASFNGELLHAWWVTFEEICAGSNKAERRYITDKVKPWITNPYLSVIPKGLQAMTIPNRLQFTASSNHPDALQLDDVDERRWGVCAVREAKYTQKEKLDVYQGFLNTDRAPGVLKHIFQNVNLTGFYPTAEAPITQAKRTMVDMGRGDWETRIQERWECLEPPFDRDLFTIRELRMQVFGQNGPNPVVLGQLLSRAPFHFKQLPNCGTKRIYASKNFDQWAKLSNAVRVDHMQTGSRPAHIQWDVEVPEDEFAPCPLL